MAKLPSPAVAGAMMCAALALWVSFGALSFVDAANPKAYVGLLPSVAWLAGLLVVAILLAIVVRPSAPDVAPLWLSAALLLPWVPAPLPRSVFIWAGALRVWTWTVVLVALVVPVLIRRWRASERQMTPFSQAIVAGGIAAVAYGWGTWATAPQHPGGDEPHYLVMTQSLIGDRDLKIENNHLQGDYRAYFANHLDPDFLRRGKNGEIYSIHAPGLSLIVLPVFALFGYPGVMVALLTVTAAASALAWLVAWQVVRDYAASWFGWAVVSLTVPLFFHASAVYPDGLGAVLMVVALLPLVARRARRPPWLAAVGAALALLPWLHTRFVVLAVSAALAIVGRIGTDPAPRAGRLAAFVLPPTISAIAWFMFFQTIYGEPDPAAPYGGATQTAVENIVRGAPGLLFDQQFGLITYAPVYLCALAGLVVMFLRGPRRLGFELFIICVPYFLAVTFFYMWWGGFSAPARFLVPVTLPLAVPAAVWFAKARSAAMRVATAALLVSSLLVTATIALVERGWLLLNHRGDPSRLVLWLSPVVDLTQALPSPFRDPPEVVWRQAAIWLLALAVPAAIAAGCARRMRHPERAAYVAVLFAVSLQMTTMAAASVVWRGDGANAVTVSSSGPALLRAYDPDAGQIAVHYRPWRRLSLGELPYQIVLARMPSISERAEVARIAHLPPGLYEVAGRLVGPPAGHIRARTDAQSPPLAEWDVAEFDARWSRMITIPVALEGLEIQIDEAARQVVRDASVRVASLPGRPARVDVDGESRRAGRYGPALIFLVRGRAWIEPGGTWIGGRDVAELVIAADYGSRTRLFVRNSAADNQVTLESGRWRQDLDLKAREERFVDLPMDIAKLGTHVTVTSVSGARPSETEPGSKDERLLGVWIEPRK